MPRGRESAWMKEVRVLLHLFTRTREGEREREREGEGWAGG